MTLVCGLKFPDFFFLRRPKNVEVSDWLWAGASGVPSGAASRPPRDPSGSGPQPVRDFYVFWAPEKEKNSKNFKPQTKVIFYLELSPLQHIKR